MPRLAADRAFGRDGTELTAEQLRITWEQAQQEPGDRAETAEEVTLFLGQIQAQLTPTADWPGLSASPDLETQYVGDVVAATLPVHIERLLQMHEQLVRL